MALDPMDNLAHLATAMSKHKSITAMLVNKVAANAGVTGSTKMH